MAVFEVREALDLYAARRGARDMAERRGFSRNDCHELAIVVSELASNILKYGVRGSISVEDTESSLHGPGILLIASDQGRPFHDLELALRDGYDDRGPIDPATLLTRGGLGTGLGAVVRLTDTFEVHNLPVGKAIHAVRFMKRPKRR